MQEDFDSPHPLPPSRRVDHDNVEGQPLSTLRSRILGRQGSYGTLGFRRKEGPETTFYDVPLMRGSPEYFDSLKANQPVSAHSTSLITPHKPA